MKTTIKLYILMAAMPILLHAQEYTKTVTTDGFVRGEKIIYTDDFARQKTGSLPADWMTNGSAAIDTTHLASGKFFRINSGIVSLANPLNLSDTYTIEFEVIPQKDAARNGDDGYGFTIMSTHKPADITYGLSRPGDAGIKFDFGGYNYYNTYYDDGALPLKGSTMGRKTLPKQEADHIYKMTISVQKERITVWRDNERIFDLPNAMNLNYKYNILRFENGTPMVRNFLVAVN